jgi:hypothetical protein
MAYEFLAVTTTPAHLKQYAVRRMLPMFIGSVTSSSAMTIGGVPAAGLNANGESGMAFKVYSQKTCVTGNLISASRRTSGKSKSRGSGMEAID